MTVFEMGEERVPPGYRRTEVGIVPEDWNVSKLGHHVTFRTGPFGSSLHKSDYTIGGIPVINPMHIVDGELIPTETMTVGEDAAKRLSDFRLKAKDIIIGRRGDMGRCAVTNYNQIGWLCGTGSLIIRCNGQVVPEYLQRVLSSPQAILSIEEASVGSTMVNLNQGVLRDLNIQLPPLPEQHAIVATLSDVDALISSLDRLIFKKRAVKTAAMQQLLTGKRRLPEFSGEWETKELGDAIERIVGGGTPSRANPAYWGNEIPWVTVKDFATFNPSNTQEAITREGLKHSASNLIPAGTLVTSTRMAVGKAIIYDVDVSINQDLKAIFPKSNVDSLFLYHWFNYHSVSIEGLGSGSTVKGISLQDLKRIEFLQPSLQEQTTIATVLSDMDAEIGALEARREKTRQIKQGMMQELLTGRTRLVEEGSLS